MPPFWMVLFWLTAGLSIYTYLGYPLILWLAGRLKPFRPHRAPILPRVSVIIPAFNEGKDIGRKLENTLSLDYPAEKLEILVGSDGSTDDTCAIAQGYAARGVRLHAFPKNRGKTAVQNDLVALSGGEVLVFTDAAAYLRPDSLRNLVAPFADERVGCVAGCMSFGGGESNLTTRSQSLYWRYELWLRRLESRLGAMIGIDGPLYAVRRSSYAPLAPHIISDLITPLLVIRQGRRVVMEEGAPVVEMPNRNAATEFSTRRRIVVRGLVGLFSHASLLNPFQFPVPALQIVSHKIIRWSVGILALLNFLSCLMLADSTLFRLLSVAYCLFAFAGVLGWLAARIGRPVRALLIPYYFTLVNLAATLGILDFIRRRAVVAWNPVR